MLHADLTVWPTLFDGFCTVGVTSLALGTPVVSWHAPPMNEFLHDGVNAALVPCDHESNWLGVIKVKPDYEEFEKTLRRLVRNEDNILSRLRKQTADGFDRRRFDFESAWAAVLPQS